MPLSKNEKISAAKMGKPRSPAAREAIAAGHQRRRAHQQELLEKIEVALKNPGEIKLITAGIQAYLELSRLTRKKK